MLLWLKGAFSPQEIRDKIMDPTSDFQQKIVEYLESVHIGEFMTGTQEEVEQEIKLEKTQNKNYQDPTQTLPDPPPPLCENENCGEENCCDCEKLESWWQKFKKITNDLIFKSNVHSCRGFKSDEKASKKNRPGCINKYGNCKARFPRKLFAQTEVDLKTGALNVKKGEPWINTLTPLVTYLLRCNSDVTSLLSGTAIKAIVAYISDYVTKPGLKTYSIFDAIRSVFNRSTEMLGGSLERKEKARRLITQTVNCLTAKMEIGGPMASLYLLGNPDHYTSHEFVPVYWKNYVREVLKFWRSEDDLEEIIPEKLVLQKSKEGQYVGFSGVHDYIYRPSIFENKTLYEWIQMATRIKATKFEDYSNIDSEDELDLINKSFKSDEVKISNYQKYKATVEEENEEEDELNIYTDDEFIEESFLNEEKEIKTEVPPSNLHLFLKEHPLYKTHRAKFDDKRKNIVPNFVGGSLPRCDRGDREYYCATMLTLFKPWRSGKDLKNIDYSWDETFNLYEFTDQQKQYMKNFNVRYECNDARDDYSAQLKKENNESGIFPQWMNSDIINDLDNDDNFAGADFGDNEPDDENDYGINKYSTLGKLGKLRHQEMEETRLALTEAGWLDNSPNGLNKNEMLIEPSILQNGSKWKASVDQERQKILSERNKNIPSKIYKNISDPNENNVQVIDRSYLQKSFKAKLISDQKLVISTINKFSLNTEQKRAFKIVANHSLEPNSDQLKMYLAGMGGTGKSRVINALMEFFKSKNESHRIVVLGPTGTSAALINGSTYHSFLGINPGENTAKKIEQVKVKLEGVNYIFIDEVSMMSCHDMYKISAQLAKALNAPHLLYGGINIIFAGDFAQLPPVGGASLFSQTVGTQVHAGLKLAGQESAIGKALWHQVTTVVILRENMRQKTQSKQDAQLRTALINMRYGKCTTEDIKFLRSLQAGKRPGQPKVSAKDFRNVSVICGRHTQKDEINSLGCQRFADETGQKLTHFYSIDKWGKEKDPATKTHWGKSKSASKLKHTSNEIDFDVQHEIWKLRHGATENFAGKLSLCIGMPVMIRNNDATELCITKGQEGFVVGWQAAQGSHEKRILDTLFVKLHIPAKTIQIPGLPENVVPLVKSTKTITCIFPSDLKESIERQQVNVLPNFAMTDYGSQGKSKDFNVVHLGSCYSHMSYYTCLSRSTSAAGTIIMQGFEPSIITRGCSGYLRQEFREHEILDDITRLKYENLLPDFIQGNTRNTLIRQY